VRASSLSVVGALVVAAALAPRAAQAQGQSQTCKIQGVVSPAFGTYDPFSTTPLDVVGSLRHNCPQNTPVRILLDRGGSATFTPRQMRSGSEVLAYNLYLDPPSSPGARIWGDGSGGTYEYNGTGKITVELYGRVFAQQDVAVGTYTDTVTVTAFF
jgi:spore coat protein U-like protein